MRKTKDISKYDLDWQVFRVSLKKLKTSQEKMNAASDYLMNNLNRADKERVMNYLEGLAMAYKDDRRVEIRSLVKELSILEVSQENPLCNDFCKYDDETLRGVAKDLNRRNKVWLSKGYRHQEHNDFMTSLLLHLGDERDLENHLNSIEESKNIQNTHSFFF